MRASLPFLVLACSLALTSSAAQASEKNPDVLACEGKKAGDACQRTVVTKPEGGPAEEKKLPGTCTEDNCCELDYSKGSPPETVCGPCLSCKEGPGTLTPPTQDAKSADAGDAAGDDDGAAPADGPAAADGSPPATDPGKRGCSVGANDKRSESWLSLLVLTALRRRRR